MNNQICLTTKIYCPIILNFCDRIIGRIYFSASTFDLPNNILIDATIDRQNICQLRPYYYHSLAVGIPLKDDLPWCNGSTVLFEAMTMSKPVIMTSGKANQIDVEKEKNGFTVGFGNNKEWLEAIRYLREHPDEVKEMGERGFALVQKIQLQLQFVL